MKLTINQIFQNADNEIKNSNFKKGIEYYKLILKIEPNNHNAYMLLGLAYHKIKYYDESIKNYEKAIKLKPNFAMTYFYLGNIFYDLKKTKDAIKNYKEAIKLQDNLVGAHFNLGNLFYGLKEFKDAIKSYKIAAKLDPNFFGIYLCLGNIFKDLGELDNAEFYFKKVISLNPKLSQIKDELQTVSKLKKLLSNIKDFSKNDNINPDESSYFSNEPFITNRPVESDIIKFLYEIDSKKFEEAVDARYGNGRCSLDFDLFEEENSIIASVSKDIIDICENALNSKIFIYDSFFNILNTKGGTTPHDHLTEFDKNKGLIHKKYSLVYYVSTGDQNCSDPGILKLYNPDKEILPSKGMIVIIPANQKHSAIYNGNKDRIMIGVNFYCL
tara:strand:+ start:95 stop:1249 length:1155 start_codon:yes stop_codon:yes gene_type:complete